ncbi:LytTR family DNA-binding domain-containing protein [Winogradskyella sp.]|uniref:LytTR family DNA-binding domain-containing protein n=1 Tax=Winogradskyella sp. TaxID=1883156 RepID=UPI00343E6B34
MNNSLTNLESNLNPFNFLRTNRTFIVNKQAISKISTYKNPRLKLILNTKLAKDIIVSREKVNTFKNWLDK